MTLRTKYILAMGLLHGTALALSFAVFRSIPWLFLASELVIFFSAYQVWRLYQQFLSPFQLLLTGVEAIRDQDFTMKFVKTGQEEMDQLIEVYNAMIDQLRRERTLQQEQHFFLEQLIETAPAGIVILDFDDKIVSVNPKMAEWAGLTPEKIRGKALSDLEAPLLPALANLPLGESRIIHLDGSRTYKCQRAHFIDRGFPRHFLIVEELTREILQAEKNAYGKVIRMMAHEVNNSIGAVNGVLHTINGAQTLPVRYAEALEICVERNDRLNRFMRNFADVVRLPAPRPEHFELNTWLAHLETLLEGLTAGRDIQISRQLASSPIYLVADKQQMEQVLINIVKNAAESIESKGHIAIITQNRPQRLIIRDSGPGISTDAEEQLFSPFFTTKKEGQGVGLTLIREILVQHGYGFSLRTVAPGQTEFSINFDATSAPSSK